MTTAKKGGKSKFFKNHGPLGLLEAITKHFDPKGRHVSTTFHKRKKTVPTRRGRT